MHPSLLCRKNALGFLVFLLCAGAYLIAHGQTGTPSGMCYIRTASTNAPGLSGPDVGKGYAKVLKPGVTTLKGLRAACTKADYDALIDKICAQNPYDKEAYGAGEVSDGVSFTGGCTAPGCGETRRCPVPPPQPPPPLTINIFSGDGQTGQINAPLPAPLVVRATRGTIPSAGQTVTWKITSGSGVLSAATSVTDVNGRASNTLIPNESNTLVTASSIGASYAVTFTENALSPPPPPPPPPAPPEEGATFTYPIPELGGCGNAKECHTYCEKPANRIGVCWDFAKAHNLLSKEEIARAEKFIKAASSGGPGSCKGEEGCFTYCESSEHLEECVQFAEKNGFVPANELQDVKKIIAYLKRGGKMPGNCNGTAECLAYCSAAEHLGECYTFAKGTGFLDKETQEQAGKFIGFMQRGETPGKCTSKDSCEAYCSGEGHFDECITFAEKAGLLPKEELEIAKKVGGKGPGGCISRESCETFCNEGTNQDVCIKFAEEHGLLSTEELGYVKKFGTLREALNQAPPEVLSCLAEQAGQDTIQKLLSGQFTPNPDLIKAARTCFETGKEAIEKQITSCASLSCGEAVICLEKLKGAETKDFKFEISPDIKEKVTGCKQEEFNQKARACINLPCSEAITCIQGLGEGEHKGESKPLPGLEEKIRGCVMQMQKGGGEGGAPPIPTGGPTRTEREPLAPQEGQQYPIPEQTEQYKQQYEQQQIPKEYCANFAQVPSCSYVGSPDSQNYQYCKQCYPNK